MLKKQIKFISVCTFELATSSKDPDETETIVAANDQRRIGQGRSSRSKKKKEKGHRFKERFKPPTGWRRANGFEEVISWTRRETKTLTRTLFGQVDGHERPVKEV